MLHRFPIPARLPSAARLAVLILAVVAGIDVLSARSEEAAALSGSVRVSLDGTARTLKQVVAELNRQLGGERLAVSPETETELAAARCGERPLREVQEALALAAHGDWQADGGRQELRYRADPVAARPAPDSLLPYFLDVNREGVLRQSLTWPPSTVERMGRELPRKPVEDDFHQGSLGAALVSAACEKSFGLVILSPALKVSRGYTGLLSDRTSPTGADLFAALASLEGARWRAVGTTYTLVVPADTLALRHSPRDQVAAAQREQANRLFAGLTAPQKQRMREGETVTGAELSEAQRRLVRRCGELHHALHPEYPRRLVEDAERYYLRQKGTSIEVGLGAGQQPLFERDRTAP